MSDGTAGAPFYSIFYPHRLVTSVQARGRIPVRLLASCDGRYLRAWQVQMLDKRDGPDTSAERSSRGVLSHPGVCLKIPSCLIWRCSSHTCATFVQLKALLHVDFVAYIECVFLCLSMKIQKLPLLMLLEETLHPES